MTSFDTEVLVVGAGPAGLTLAGELARKGVACRIIDRATEPALQSRALVLHCATLELLEAAGLRERLANQGIPIRGMRFSRGGPPLAKIPFDLGRYPALSLPQHETEAILRAALGEQGVSVEWGTALTSLAQDAGSVVATTNAGTITAEYVVGCDGAHSTVRHLTGIEFEGSSQPETLWMADAAVDWKFTPDHVWQFLESRGALSAIPMPAGLWRLVTLSQAGERTPDAKFFEAAVARCARVAPARVELKATSAFQVHCRLAEKYGEGRVLLAGDAAHIHSPIGGQGMNVGMQDAFSLGARLASVQRRDPAALLASYQAERRPVAARVISANARISRLAASRQALPRFVRDRVMPVLLNLRPVARRAGLEASGLAADAQPGGRRHDVREVALAFLAPLVIASTAGFMLHRPELQLAALTSIPLPSGLAALAVSIHLRTAGRRRWRLGRLRTALTLSLAGAIVGAAVAAALVAAIGLLAPGWPTPLPTLWIDLPVSAAIGGAIASWRMYPEGVRPSGPEGDAAAPLPRTRERRSANI